MITIAHPASAAPAGPAEFAPPPGSADEKQRFAALQQRLPGIFERLFPDRLAAQTIVVVPSMSLDVEELPKLAGACHYEERLLCLLMLLRRPGIRIVYVTSRQLAPATVEYTGAMDAGSTRRSRSTCARAAPRTAAPRSAGSRPTTSSTSRSETISTSTARPSEA